MVVRFLRLSKWKQVVIRYARNLLIAGKDAFCYLWLAALYLLTLCRFRSFKMRCRVIFRICIDITCSVLQIMMKSLVKELKKIRRVALMSDQVFFQAAHALRSNQNTSLLDVKCASQKYMLLAGLVQSSGVPGVFAYSPLLMRPLENLNRMVHKHMSVLGAQQVRFYCFSLYNNLDSWTFVAWRIVILNTLTTIITQTQVTTRKNVSKFAKWVF